jgi:hypothetical protein
METSEFLSIQNFEKIVSIFVQYMQDEQNVSIPLDNLQEVKVKAFNIMRLIKAKHVNMGTPLKQLNNILLNEMRDTYLEEHNLTPNRKPVVKSLSRDQDLFGKRQVMTNQIKPAISSFSREDTVKNFDVIMSQRRPDHDNTILETKLPFATIKEDMLKPDVLSDKLKSFEEDRLKTSVELTQQQRDIMTQDPKSIFTHFDSELMKNSQKQPKQQQEQNARVSYFENSSTATVIPSQSIHRGVTRYALFNGYDRKWDVYPRRFNFALETDDLSTSLKNIIELRFTKLIIPLEVTKGKINETENLGRPLTYYRFGMTQPYLILSIDEVQGLYDGISSAVKKSTTAFIFEKAYTADNGRGFMILEPVQDEARVYYPNPMATLPKLTFSVLRPNGVLFNMSADDNSLISLSYSPVDNNKLYLRLTTKRFFDKNELNIGDVIMFKSFTLPSKQQFTNQLQNEMNRAPTQNELDVYGKGIQQVESFMNRLEGHEVQNLGTASHSGLYKEFIIFIPRALNTLTGNYEIDNDFANTFNAYLGNTISSTYNNFASMLLLQETAMLNMTLQVSISMTIKTAAADVTGLQATLH